jgi:hypothetical protein
MVVAKELACDVKAWDKLGRDKICLKEKLNYKSHFYERE